MAALAQTMPHKYLTAAQVVERWDGAVSAGTLANWRTAGKGPAYQKFGNRVRYPIAHLEAWEAQNMVGTAANDNHHTEPVTGE